MSNENVDDHNMSDEKALDQNMHSETGIIRDVFEQSECDNTSNQNMINDRLSIDQQVCLNTQFDNISSSIINSDIFRKNPKRRTFTIGFKCFHTFPLTPNIHHSLFKYSNFKAIDSYLFKLLRMKNSLSLKMPSFVDILTNNLLSPFFVFQFFSNLLFLYDEYFYHGLFSIVMQVVFEMTVAFARMQSLKIFGKSDVPNITLHKVERQSVVTNRDLTGIAKSNQTDNHKPDKGYLKSNTQIARGDSLDDNQIDNNKLNRCNETTDRETDRSNQKVYINNAIVRVRSDENEPIINSNQNATNSTRGWSIIKSSSEDLYPGDIVILTENVQIPCDLLILRGECSVNEAMLTGESIPLHKESICNFNLSDVLSYSKHKRCILYGGTDLVKISAPRDAITNQDSDRHKPKPEKGTDGSTSRIGQNGDSDGYPSSKKSDFCEPKGCITTESPHKSSFIHVQTIDQSSSQAVYDLVDSNFKSPHLLCYILNTGYHTSKGVLLNKMNESSDPQQVSYESYLFIFCLLCFALIGCFILIYDYCSNEIKPRKKLIVEMIMLLTSVVPTELPMEMSLAVNSALQSLMRAGVFCLEPFLIVVCGKVDVVCFDKTGTLTESELSVKHILPANHSGVNSVKEGFCNKDSQFKRQNSVVKHDSEVSASIISKHRLRDSLDHSSSPSDSFLSGSLSSVRHSRRIVKKKTKHSTKTNPEQPGINTITEVHIPPNSSNDNTQILSNPNSSFFLAMTGCACHSLVKTVEVLGDPMETALVKFFNIEVISDTKSIFEAFETQIIKRWAFQSELRRMTVICNITAGALGKGRGKSPGQRLGKVMGQGQTQPQVNDQSMGSSQDSHHNYRITPSPALCGDFVIMKGAPEVVKHFLKDIPHDYDEYLQWAKGGYRVLSIAYKRHTKEEVREACEKDLIHAGFVVFQCEIKKGSLETVSELIDAGIKVVMITGDNLETAVAVSKQLSMFYPNNRDLIREHSGGRGCVSKSQQTFMKNGVCSIEGKKEPIKSSDNEVKNQDIADQDPSETSQNQNCLIAHCIADDYSEMATGASQVSCHTHISRPDDQWMVEGEDIDKILQDDQKFYKITVFARANPHQKELIIKKYKAKHTVMMVGDGTNDVGALKAAQVGVALVEPPKKKTHAVGFVNDSQNRISYNTNQLNTQRSTSNSTRSNTNNCYPPNSDLEDKRVQLGDASIAAPFTSKTSISSITTIIKQGRATLATTTQMHKILAMNCIITAFSMSILDLMGIKYGETQLIISGLIIASAFMFITKSQPSKKISTKKPIKTIFNKYTITSILMQTAIHIMSFIILLKTITKNEIYKTTGFGFNQDDIIKVSNEELEIENIYYTKTIENVEEFNKRYDQFIKFRPSTINSLLFILSITQQITTFVVNYIGEPYRESMMENRNLRNSLMIAGGICMSLMAEINEGLSRLMEIAPLNGEGYKLMCIAVIDFILCYISEQICFKTML